jgi:hypothetical protein
MPQPTLRVVHAQCMRAGLRPPWFCTPCPARMRAPLGAVKGLYGLKLAALLAEARKAAVELQRGAAHVCLAHHEALIVGLFLRQQPPAAAHLHARGAFGCSVVGLVGGWAGGRVCWAAQRRRARDTAVYRGTSCASPARQARLATPHTSARRSARRTLHTALLLRCVVWPWQGSTGGTSDCGCDPHARVVACMLAAPSGPSGTTSSR